MNKPTPAKRLTAADFDQDLLDLYDDYAHGKISKREFLDRAGKWAVGGLTAAAILGTLSPNYALAQQVAEDDPDITGEDIVYASPDGTGDITAYIARPAQSDPDRPPAAILVVHENRGLNPLYSRCRPSPRKGRFHRDGTRWPVLSGRISRHR